jgi:anti-sigma regulatory factor (Ser/Thr protein kinase)
VEGEFRVAETPPKFVHKFEAEGLNFPYEIFTGGVSNLAPDAAPPLEVPSVPLSVIQSFTVDLGQIGFASTWAMGVLSAWGFPSERLPETELALAEAVGNVARHSGLVETRGVLSILVAADATGFSITVIDEGKPFDSATAEIREREGDTEHGMGLGLIRTLVDGVSYEYRDGANRLTIRLLRNKP